MSFVPSQALLLAGGIGTRLRPLTDVLPKCLMPICGRPLLGIWLDRLLTAGVGKVVVNTHHHASLVQAFVSAGSYGDRVVLSHETTLLGTAGTLIRNAPSFGASPILYAYADNLSLFDLEAFASRHRARTAGTILTMMTFTTDTPSSCGIVELDEGGRMLGFHEKKSDPPSNLANAAIYMLEPQVAELASALPAPRFDFSLDVMPHLLGRAQTFHNDWYHRDIGTPASLALAQFEYPAATVGLEAAGQGMDAVLDSEEGLHERFVLALARAYPSSDRVRGDHSLVEPGAAETDE